MKTRNADWPRQDHPAVAIGCGANQNGFETLFTTAADSSKIFRMPASRAICNSRSTYTRPMVFTANKPLMECGKVLRDEGKAPAILDRVLERGRFIQLDGGSGRAELLPTLSREP